MFHGSGCYWFQVFAIAVGPALKYAEVVEEDQQQHGGADVAQQEDEDAVNAEFQLSVVGDLVPEYLPVEFPADEDAGEESARGQQDVGRQEVV